MPIDDPAFTKDLDGEPPAIRSRGDDPPPAGGGASGPSWPMLVALAGALLGAAFSALSTSDFMQHLDRQVHAIHCSFIPGAAKEIAESGCRTVMMSPYSSFFREQLWGGIPISLWSLAVFAFLAYRAALVLWRGEAQRGELRVLVWAAALPVAMSVLFGVLAVWKLDALCKVCVGIYAASALTFAGVLVAERAPLLSRPSGRARLAPALGEGTGLVALLTVAYVVLAPAPDPKTSMLGCSSLVRPEDPGGVMVPLRDGRGGTPSVELLDPLCPSCKAFDQRLQASSLHDRLALKGVLFPLDSRCNWMVTESIHPGACAVSEAVLCAAGNLTGRWDAGAARAVLGWAFENQADLRALAAKDEAGLRARIAQQFPAVKDCLGGALVRNKLTKSLRWAVANALPVLTPQLFVGDSRMCDEDTDLGLEYTLARMLSPEADVERARLRALRPKPAPRLPAPVAGAVEQAALVQEPAGAPAQPRGPAVAAEPAPPAGGAPAGAPAPSPSAAPPEPAPADAAPPAPPPAGSDPAVPGRASEEPTR